jgi:hypothetical protein
MTSHCEFCFEEFSNKRSLDNHKKNRTERCLNREKLIKDKFQNVDVERDKEQKKINANELAIQNNVPNFYEIIVKAEFTFDYLFDEINKGRRGLSNIFKQYYFTNNERKKFCIKIYDLSRDLYGIFNGTRWERVSLYHIVETFLNQIQQCIQKIIISKKLKLLDDIDKQHTPYFVALFDESPDRNDHLQKTQAVYDKYDYVSYLNSLLLYQEDECFIKKIQFRIRNCINTSLA